MIIAGLALAHDFHPHSPSLNGHFMRVMARQNIQTIIDALVKVTRYYAGAAGGLGVLKRATGMTSVPSDSDTPNPLIPLPDTGMLRRFTLDSNHPKHLAQPTDTSLRDSFGLPLGNDWTLGESLRHTLIPGTSFLNDLLQGYTFEDMTFLPEDMLDMSRVLDMP